MKISEMIKSLEEIMQSNGDLRCFYTTDKGRKIYRPVDLKPSVLFVNCYGEVFQKEDFGYCENPEDIFAVKAFCAMD